MRECGECIVCCVYPHIIDNDLKKEGMSHCPHLTLPGEEKQNEVYYTGASFKNCKIFSNQPKVCAKYWCSWRLGYGGEDDRPDKILMLFDNSRGIENTQEAKPLSNNQEETPEAMEAINRISHDLKCPVIVLNFYERRIKRIVGRGV
jgi:hypothetical protein